MARKVPISPLNTKRGQGWWKCPYCKAGGQGYEDCYSAANAAHYHFLGKHRFRDFSPYYTKT